MFWRINNIYGDAQKKRNTQMSFPFLLLTQKLIHVSGLKRLESSCSHYFNGDQVDAFDDK